MELVRGRLLVAVLAIASLGAATAPSSSNVVDKRQSLQSIEARRQLDLLDQLEREQARKRESIARMRAEDERRSRNDRTVMLMVCLLAGVAVIVVERRRRDRMRRR